MTRWLIAPILALTLSLPAFAQDNADDVPAPDEEYQDPALLPVPAEPSAAEREAAAKAQIGGARTQRAAGASLRGLDKITGKTQDIDLANGESFQLGRLQVRLAECRNPQADPSSDAFAELTILDENTNKTVFSGWMIASSPALSALDDARYDVWVMSCKSS
ncbi:DUF2155 domain-containing protein [Paracoccus aminophilus]|uniref:DUF2155 domain-containing protein n=1 Tax=Paracoccus aminophilus JCM 7686 TaxID=1367847 RepID=S5XU20_PARAH|nr:DUF2155 domain-containing protein [Paracoccus aminophilus]AGT08677.1 hypothetical protein JCM7686_1576 [Paracoccus aminophilus JCM 7686]